MTQMHTLLEMLVVVYKCGIESLGYLRVFGGLCISNLACAVGRLNSICRPQKDIHDQKNSALNCHSFAFYISRIREYRTRLLLCIYLS